MEYKWIGAVLIILGCGGFGFSLAAQHRREESALRQLIAALEYMTCELQFRMTPLPELCIQAGQERTGSVRQVLLSLAQRMQTQASPDVAGCMNAVLAESEGLPMYARKNLAQLGTTLGRFDLNGQLKGLESARESCRRDLASLENNRDARLRSYQTLGLCTGAALAILFI